MPITTYSGTPTDPIQRMQLAYERQNRTHEGWLEREIDRQTEPLPRPSLARTAELATQLYSIGVQSAEATAYHGMKLAMPSDHDDDFDVAQFATEDFFDRHPWMLEHFVDGTVLDLPNEQRFWHFVSRKEQDFARREEIGRAGFVRAAIPTLAVGLGEAFAGYGLLRAAGLGRQLGQIGAWARGGGRPAQIARWGTLGAGENMAWELALHGVHHTRNEDLTETLPQAALFGFAFAGAIPAIAGGRNKLGQITSTARIHRVQRQITEALEDPRALDAIDQIRSDAEALQELIREGQLTIGHRLEARGRFADIDAVGADRTRHVSFVRTKETDPLIRQAEETWGDMLQVHDHPAQPHVDWLTSLQELDAAAGHAIPADLGPIAGRLAGAVARGIPARNLEIPGYALMNTPSSLARSAGRLLFDFSWPTEATMRDPINTHNRAPAEALKWNLDAARDRVIVRVDDALKGALAKDGGFTYTTAQGERLEVSSRTWHKQNYHRAVIDYLRQLDEHARGHREQPEAPAAVKKGAAAVRHYARQMGREATDVQLLKHLDPGRIYLPRRWRADIIRLRRSEFKTRLVQQWRKNRDIDYWTGRRLDAATRQVAPEVYQVAGPRPEGRGLTPEDRAAIGDLYDRQLAATPDAPLTEAQLRQHLGEDTYGRYVDEVSIYHDRAADSTIDTLTGMEADAGVDIRGTSVYAHRTLDVDETQFAEFLDQGLESLLGYYHRHTAGRIASRRAIKNAAEDWSPIVKEYTGKDLAESGYDPALVIEAVRRDFQKLLDAFAHKPDVQAGIEKAMDKTVGARDGILAHKLNDLEGRPVFPGNPAGEAGWGLWLARNTLRLPYMAGLGKMALSSMTDVANFIVAKGMTPRHIGTVTEALALVRQVPARRHHEGLYVAFSDMANSTRSMELGEVAGLADSRQFGPGTMGRFMAKSDAGLDWMSRKFATLSTQNRWNTNMKRAAATIITDEYIHGAVRMARAADMMDGGMSQADALKAVKLSEADAQRWNRLGMNADRARRLRTMIDQHGVDWQGNRINSSHEGFISPEYQRWWREDRDLFETLTWAVNAETLNIIVEPKMMSRPLANHRWLGRAFNQFQSFFYAWGGQFAPLAAMSPRYQVAQYVMLTTALGAMVDGLHNHLSGRRRLDDTIRLWQEQPTGMTWAAITRSALLGWFVRPVGFMENTPYGVGKLLGNEAMSQQYTRPLDLAGQFGPSISFMQDASSVAQDVLYQNQWNDATHRRAWRTIPYRNLWWLEATIRTAEEMGYGEMFPFNLAPEATGAAADRP